MRTNVWMMVALACLCSCANPQQSGKDFAEVKNSRPENNIRSLNFESFRLDSVETSYIGQLAMKGNEILLVDKRTCEIFRFDTDGRFIRKEVGFGPGPKEIATGQIDGYAPLDEGHFIVGAANDCHIFSDAYEFGKKFILRKGNRDVEHFDSTGIYTLCYPHLLMRQHGEYLYYTVNCQKPGMSFFDDHERYFTHAHYLAKLNLNTGEVEEMLGKFPSVYATQRNLRQFSFVDFDIKSSGEFVVAFEADSLIYEYDKDFRPLRTYGYAGRGMVLSDRVRSTPKDFSKHYADDRQAAGYYTHLSYIDETGLLFRDYQRGGDAKHDGLQIYRNGTLLGDIDVPLGFEVLGYMAPYYYATTGLNYDGEYVKILKFKLSVEAHS